MKKRVVGLLITMLLCLSSAIYSAGSAAAAAKTSADFTDLKDLDAATKAKFDAMISAGVFDGVAEGTFGLKDEMNRAQFAKVAALIFNLEVDKDSKTSSFKDVKADDPANGYALPYIEAVKAAGITDGYGDGVYNPSGKVTKEQLATFLIRGLGKDAEAQATPGVNDKSVSDWAKGYVALALEKKLMSNGADGTFGGQSNATRDLLVTGAYEAKEQHGAQVEAKKKEEEQKKKEEEEKKKEEELKKAEEEKKHQSVPSSSPVTQSGPSSSSPAPQQPVQATVETPTALPAGGTVTSGTQVTLTSTTASAEVYYTTDLSEPTTSSTRYTGPITITSNTTIKAIAIKTGSKNSPVARFEYTVKMPILLPDSIQPMTEGDLYTGSVAKLSGGTGAVTYAVTDGALPEGLALNPITGEITGIPSVSGGYDFTISATDSATPPATETKQYTGTISPALSSKTPLDLINEAAESGDWTGVDESIFAAAGITGVTSVNLPGIQGVLQDYDWPSRALPKDKNQIQTIVTETIYINAINNYFADGYGVEPDKEAFELAGLKGVTDENLTGIITYLQSKYRGAGGEPGGDPGGFPGGFPGDDYGEIPGDGSGGFPGGFPGDGSGGSLYSGSSKQEVQAVIDEYLENWGQMNILE